MVGYYHVLETTDNNYMYVHVLSAIIYLYMYNTKANIIYMYFANANTWVKVNSLPHALPQEKLEQLRKVPRHIENAWAKTNIIHSGYLQESVTLTIGINHVSIWYVTWLFDQLHDNTCINTMIRASLSEPHHYMTVWWHFYIWSFHITF